MRTSVIGQGISLANLLVGCFDFDRMGRGVWPDVVMIESKDACFVCRTNSSTQKVHCELSTDEGHIASSFISG